MTAEGSVGGAAAQSLSKQRDADHEKFETKKAQIKADAERGQKRIDDKFDGAEVQADKDQQFRAATVGLVTAADFNRLREVSERRDSDADALPSPDAKSKTTKASKKKKKKMMSTLSFADDEDQDDGDMEPSPVKKKSKKDTSVDTSFLPDKDRAATLATEERRLKREWTDSQALIKSEKLAITFSYWDGSGHRREIVVTKGSTVGEFLDAASGDLQKEFREVGGADTLMYVKEDLMLPQDITFYDLISTKARGKSGPLFKFDVSSDIQFGAAAAADARVERDDSHPGKVVDRRWYERNKHIFPASRWENWDPAKNYSRAAFSDGK